MATHPVLLHDFDSTFFSSDRNSATDIAAAEQRAALVAKIACFIHGEIRTNAWQPLDTTIFGESSAAHELLTLGPKSPLKIIWQSPEDSARPFTSWLVAALRRTDPATMVFSSVPGGTKKAIEWSEFAPSLRDKSADDVIKIAEDFDPGYKRLVQHAALCDPLGVPYANPISGGREIGSILDEIAPLFTPALHKPETGWYRTRSAAQQAFVSSGKVGAELLEAMAPYDLCGTLADAKRIGATPLLNVTKEAEGDVALLVGETHGEIDAIEINFDTLQARQGEFVRNLQRTTFKRIMDIRAEPDAQSQLSAAWKALGVLSDCERHTKASVAFDRALDHLRRSIRSEIQAPPIDGEITLASVLKMPIQPILKAGARLIDIADRVGHRVHGIVHVRARP